MKRFKVNFCRTFISNISLFLELAGSYLFGTHTIQPSQSYMALVILKCQKMPAFRIESFPCNHSIYVVQQTKTKDSNEIQSKNRQLMIEIISVCY